MNPVERYYDRLASQYDALTASTGGWTSPRKVGALIRDRFGPGLTWLVIGVGTGQDLEAIFSSAPSHVEAVDVSRKMLDMARQKFPDAIFHHGNFLTFGDLQLPTYDVIVCSGVLEYCRDAKAHLRVFERFLSGRGSIIVTFEPVIDGYGSQSEFVSEIHADEIVGIDIFGLKTYRLRLQDFLDQANEVGLSPTMLDAFVAFFRGDDRVIYNLAVLQRRADH